MELPVPIDNIEEYEFVTSRGHQPLLDTTNFSLTNELRRDIQRLEFSGGVVAKTRSKQQANSKFYRWVWKWKQPHGTKRCEECMKPLHEYSASFISHILTRGAHPEMAHDPRNTNILCFECHNKWEHDKKHLMRIYEPNQTIINTLRHEYSR